MRLPRSLPNTPTTQSLPVTAKDLKDEKKNVTRKELAISINEKMGVSQRNASDVVETVFSTMKQFLVAGDLVKLVQFGTLAVRDKSPRRGRNPRTGEAMTITKRQMISFRPSRRLRELLNE